MPHISTADGTALYVKDWGSGRPVVLLHGWPLSADSWDDIAVPLVEAGHRVIAYDRRGFGRSGQPWTSYDYDTLTDDLAAVIGEAAVHDATLIGFSMGGGEVARYMSRHEGKDVKQAVLVSSVVPYMLKTDTNPNGVDAAVFDQMTHGIKEDRAKFFAAFFKDFFGVGLVKHPVSEPLIEWARATAMAASLKATLACAQSFATTDFRNDLPAFRVPTLVIHGTADKTVPIDATGRAAAKAVRQSTLIEYDGSPHGVFATDKARLTQDILDFLRR